MATKIEVTNLNALDDNLVEGQKVVEIILGPTIGADTAGLSHAVEQAEDAAAAAELAEAGATDAAAAAASSEERAEEILEDLEIIAESSSQIIMGTNMIRTQEMVATYHPLY